MAKIIGNTTATPNPISDWHQNDSTKADYIKNRTHYEKTEVVTGDTLYWDGNTEGLVSVDNSRTGNKLYLVSNETPAGLSYGNFYITTPASGTSTDDYISGDNYWCIGRSPDVLIVYENNTILQGGPYVGMEVSKAGIYFENCINTDGDYISALQILDYTFISTKTTLKQLDSKFIPNDIARVGQIDNKLAEVQNTLTEDIDALRTRLGENDSIISYLLGSLSGGLRREIVLPEVFEGMAEPQDNVIYMVGPKEDGTYDEYMYIASSFSFELIGSTSVELSDYVTIEQHNADVGSLNNRVSELEQNGGTQTVIQLVTWEDVD